MNLSSSGHAPPCPFWTSTCPPIRSTCYQTRLNERVRRRDPRRLLLSAKWRNEKRGEEKAGIIQAHDQRRQYGRRFATRLAHSAYYRCHSCSSHLHAAGDAVTSLVNVDTLCEKHETIRGTIGPGRLLYINNTLSFESTCPLASRICVSRSCPS